MQFIVVATDELADIGRQLAHALSLHEQHSGTYWTVKHYEDNEASLAKQPVIFLGDSKVARAFTAVLPKRFSEYGTSCWVEGSKAVLLVETPALVNVDDLAKFRRVVEGRAEELRHIAETTADEQPPGTSVELSRSPAAETTPPGVSIALALQPVFEVSRGVVQVVVRIVNSGHRRRDYVRLQRRYLLDRFLASEFDGFVEGVDGR